MPQIQAPKGTFDILPNGRPGFAWQSSAAYDYVIGTHRRIAALHGYQFIQTPTFEATEMFERGIGAGTDVVDKEMYSFATAGGDELTLRPEGTPATVRAVLSAHLDQEVRPVRVQYAGPMFRHDKNQRGRYRQFHQVGVELIGERGPQFDTEVIEVGWRFYAALGITGVSLQINTLGDLDDRRRYREALVAHFTPITAELCDDCRRRLTINPLRLLDCKNDAQRVADAPRIADSLSAESTAYFAAVLAGLRAAGIEATVNDRLVRGLDYYAHTAFEFWHTGLAGAQNALGGGGRYDGLAEVLGFAATPGVGYALGVERALLILEEAEQLPVAAGAADVVVVSAGDGNDDAASAAARLLRDAGHAAILDIAQRKLDKKIRGATRHGARVLVIIGETEREANSAVVRDLESRDQTTVAIAGLAGAVSAALAEGKS